MLRSLGVGKFIFQNKDLRNEAGYSRQTIGMIKAYMRLTERHQRQQKILNKNCS